MQNSINEIVQFAKMLQGKNPKDIVENMIKQQNLDPNALEQAKQFATQTINMFNSH